MEALIILISALWGIVFSSLAEASNKVFYLFSPLLLSAVYLTIPFTLKSLNIAVSFLVVWILSFFLGYYLNNFAVVSFNLFLNQGVYLLLLAVVLFLAHSLYVPKKV